MDPGDPSGPDTLFGRAMELPQGSLDVLLNNAGPDQHDSSAQTPQLQTALSAHASTHRRIKARSLLKLVSD